MKSALGNFSVLSISNLEGSIHLLTGNEFYFKNFLFISTNDDENTMGEVATSYNEHFTLTMLRMKKKSK